MQLSPATATLGPIFKVFIRPIYDDCDITISVPEGVFIDQAGNGNVAFYWEFHYRLYVSVAVYAHVQVLIDVSSCSSILAGRCG